MSKVNFTSDRVASFECKTGKNQSIYWDAKTPGLGLRVTEAGAKSYIFETRLHGKTIRLTIGDIRTWPIGKAQSEATRFKALTDQGIDPRQQMAAQRSAQDAATAEAKRQSLTLQVAWDEYLKARKPKWQPRTYRDHLLYTRPGGETKKIGEGETMAMPLAALMPLQLSELTPERIAAWLNVESETRPTSAAKCYRLLRAFINWTADREAFKNLIPVNACSGRSVRDAVPNCKPKAGDCLEREQLAGWFAEVRKCSPVVRAYLQALLITGSRREELASLQWADVDFQWRKITIRDKVDGSRVIPMTPYVTSLLLGLKALNEAPPNQRQLRRLGLDRSQWMPSPWVFFSARGEFGRLTSPTKAHNEAVAAAGLPHLTIHGLRRSFGTLSEWVDVPSGVTAQIMGHKPSALAEKHYRRRPIDMLRKWHDEIESWMLTMAGIEFQPAAAGLRIVNAA
ncbi:tyrosine-type recombinase/integrase [Massilia sp. PWRC2]|uniref:tyrosine-type recombinase/integrase n=1 Tax=Massilia sp. PWRC2 TaxID=2804626 RepID=UPI003CEAE41E